ncbi:hypothetical protein BLOT_014843 [Blomia tropicalis]|nr:hypothetical protein BLOT_014843 [Blomia tropicalis]
MMMCELYDTTASDLLASSPASSSFFGGHWFSASVKSHILIQILVNLCNHAKLFEASPNLKYLTFSKTIRATN